MAVIMMIISSSPFWELSHLPKQHGVLVWHSLPWHIFTSLKRKKFNSPVVKNMGQDPDCMAESSFVLS